MGCSFAWEQWSSAARRCEVVRVGGSGAEENGLDTRFRCLRGSLGAKDRVLPVPTWLPNLHQHLSAGEPIEVSSWGLCRRNWQQTWWVWEWKIQPQQVLLTLTWVSIEVNSVQEIFLNSFWGAEHFWVLIPAKVSCVPKTAALCRPGETPEAHHVSLAIKKSCLDRGWWISADI